MQILTLNRNLKHFVKGKIWKKNYIFKLNIPLQYFVIYISIIIILAFALTPTKYKTFHIVFATFTVLAGC